jgi:hypothetical protein
MTSISTRAEVFPPGEHYVRDELDERGGTEEELAGILGRPVQTVSGILNGRKQTPPHLGRARSPALRSRPRDPGCRCRRGERP